MLNKKISRRMVLKASSTLAGAAALAAAGAWRLNDGTQSTLDARKFAQISFIESVLKKHSASSKTVTEAEIQVFAARYTQVNGVVDYKRLFTGIGGEYRLTRIFVRSVRGTTQA